MQKQITVIGASAGVGLLCVTQALAKGHKVVALSRTTDSYPNHPNLVVVKGSATNVSDLKKAIDNSNAVLVALGTGTSMKATTLYTDAATALINAQNETQTQIPFIVLTGFGAGDSPPYQGFLMRNLMKLLLGAVYKNKTQMEEMMVQSTIKCEFVRPGRLTDGALTEKYRVVTAYNPSMNISKISRADVADYMIKQAENPTNLGKYPALSY